MLAIEEFVMAVFSGTDSSETIFGSSEEDTITGGAGNDTLVGGAGNDSIVSGAGTGLESLVGGDGDDTIVASSETDFAVIRTNLGNDRIEFEGSPGFWEVRYSDDGLTQVVSTFDAATDLLTVEEFINQTLVGTDIISGFGNIVATGGLSYYGTTGADNFTGTPAAFERLRYIGGNDTFHGGEGVDEVDLRAATAGATVDLASGTAVISGGDQLTLSDVERVRGTSLADSLTGDSSFNSFRPRGG